MRPEETKEYADLVTKVLRQFNSKMEEDLRKDKITLADGLNLLLSFSIATIQVGLLPAIKATFSDVDDKEMLKNIFETSEAAILNNLREFREENGLWNDV